MQQSPSTLLGSHERRLDQVFGHEPDLELVLTDDAADDEIVGAFVAVLRCEPRHRPAILRARFRAHAAGVRSGPAALRDPSAAANQRRLGNVVRHGQTHAAEQLDAFRDRIDQLVLLLVVLVEEEMELIEGRARHLQ